MHPELVLNNYQVLAAVLTLDAGEQDSACGRGMLRTLLTVRAVEFVDKGAETKVCHVPDSCPLRAGGPNSPVVRNLRRAERRVSVR
jgi:hypothetical protein